VITIKTPTTAPEMAVVIDVVAAVWASPVAPLSVEMLMAISHSGGYVSIAFDQHDPDAPARAVAASVGILARHSGQPALHSHITGVLASARSNGLGRTIKRHQREWAAANRLDRIVWTFDPLVRRNAWFNIAVLGAEVVEYLPSFYGSMADAINIGDDSDRLLVAWDVHGTLTDGPADRSRTVPAGCDFVPTPDDIVTLRQTDPVAVARWRADTRRALAGALDAGRPIIGFTPAGEYVIGSLP
jgi:predicted GNAT superfamily acetyltransferase